MVPIRSHEPKAENNTSPQSAFLSCIEDNHHTPVELSEMVGDATTSQTTRAVQSVLASSTTAPTHTRINSTLSTTTSISETSPNSALGLELTSGGMRRILEEVVVVDVEKTVITSPEASDKVEALHTQEVQINTVVDKFLVRTICPTLANTRSNSFFDVREGDSTPRRWKRKMDRNAMANPGASMYIPNDS